MAENTGGFMIGIHLTEPSRQKIQFVQRSLREKWQLNTPKSRFCQT
jgi:hypothetical protein